MAHGAADDTPNPWGAVVARIRTLKPETPSDEALASVSRDARLTFVYLITQADDDGLIPASGRQLLGALFPHDRDVTEAMVTRWCDELAAMGCVRWRTTRGGSPVLEIVNWQAHQKIKHRAKPVLALSLVPYTDADSVARPTLNRPTDALRRISGGSPEDGGSVSPTNQQPITMDLGPTSDHGPWTNNDQVVDPADGRHRALLAAAANKGVTLLFGETPQPRFRWDQPGAFALCEALYAEAMPFAHAVSAVFDAARTSKTAEGAAPRSLKYYVGPVTQAWRGRQQQLVNSAALPMLVTPAEVPDTQIPDAWAIAWAQDGSSEWQAYCDERALVWRAAS